jgi:predicted ATPase
MDTRFPGTNTLWLVRLFDGPVLEDTSGNVVRRFRSQRVGALLAYLALHLGQPCPREELYEALWPDEDTLVVANRLRVALASLRRQMEPSGIPFGSVIDVSDAGRVRLRAETVWCDIAAFERAWRTGQKEEAARLIGGVLLPGYYDAWTLEARERFEVLREELHGVQFLHHAAAVVTLTPPRAPEAPRHRLPLYLTRFFGREAERQRLLDLVADNRLVTVTGPGGVGKTRLTVETLRESDRGVVFIPLAELPDPDHVADAALLALRVTPSTDADPVEKLIAILRPRNTSLLILDNTEHLMDAVVSLSVRLLDAVPDLHLVITSRQRLDIPGEATLLLEPLEPPRYTSAPERLVEFPAVALFLDRARNARPDFMLTSRHVRALVEICRRLEGMPLALELAAARVTSQTPAQIAATLATNLMDLKSRQRGLSERHRSLRAAIQGSFDLLTPELQAFFAQLAVFQGGWTVEAARAVTGSAETEAALEELAIRSLVVAREDEATEVMRYSFLETLRQFAAEQLSLLERSAGDVSADRNENRQNAAIQEMARRHADYYLAVAEQAAPRIDEQGASNILAELEREKENLRAALRWAIDTGAVDLAHRFADALSGFWSIRGYLSDGRRTYESLLRASDGAPAPTLARLHLGCGVFATRQNELHSAKQHIETSRALYRQERNEYGILRCTQALGDACRLGGEHDRALAHYRVCLELCESVGRVSDLANCHHGLGVSSIYRGEYEAARHHLETALSLRQRMSNPLQVARTQNLLAFALVELAERDEAERLFRTSLAVFLEHGDRWYQASTIGALARIAHARGEVAAARVGLEDSLAIVREIGSQESVADLLHYLTYVYVKLGCRDEARRAAREAVEIALHLRNTQSIAAALECSSAVLESLGHYDPSARLLAAASVIRKQLSIVPNFNDRANHPRIREALQQALEPSRLDAATQAGERFSPEEAADLALTLL